MKRRNKKPFVSYKKYKEQKDDCVQYATKVREWKRAGRFNQHHIVNRKNGGLTIASNLLRMDMERHKALHFLFGNLSFREIAHLLLRVDRIKNR